MSSVMPVVNMDTRYAASAGRVRFIAVWVS